MSDTTGGGISGFFLLKRFYTRRGVQFLWYAILLLWLVEFSDQWMPYAGAAAGGSTLNPAEWGTLIYGLLAALIYLFVARLLLEVAVAVLFDEETGSARS